MRKKLVGLVGLLLACGLSLGIGGCSALGLGGASDSLSEASSSSKSSSVKEESSSSIVESDSSVEESSKESDSSQTPQEPVVVEWSDGDGVDFDVNDVTYEIAPFESMPRAYEAYIHVPTSITGSAGVVYGNYTGYANSEYIMISIAEGGVPIISFNNVQVAFTQVDVRSDNFVHLAICVDKNNNTAKCYIDGELAQLVENVSVGDVNVERTFRIGGDLRNGNPAIFKGRVRSMAFYKDIRISREVAEDVFGVETMDENLIAAYDFNKIASGDTKVADLSANKNDLAIEKVWLDSVDPVGEYAHSFAVVGDTQYIVRDNPEKLATIYEWILANQDSKNIEYVMGLGDIVEHLYMEEANLAVEWQTAREAISMLDGKIGYSLVRGNHDHSRFFNETFGEDVYLSGVDGIYQGIENSYRTIVAGNYQYLIMTLDYEPDAGELAWANDVVAAYPNHRVIITTHSYLHYNTDYTNNCAAIWTEFASKHANIMMILSGHVAWDPVMRQDEGVNGNVVTQLLIDPQDVDWYTGSTGLVAMFYMSEDGSSMDVRYYSTIRNQYYRSENQFHVDLGDYANLGLVGADTEEPKIKTINPQMGIAGKAYTLPQIVVTDNSDATIATTYIVYKKGDASETPLTVTDGAFTPTEGGYYVMKITATDGKNTATYTVDLPVRANALAANVLEDFANEATMTNFTGGATAEWLASFEGASGVLHLLPNQTDTSYYWFRLFEATGDYALPFNSITLRIWVDAEDANGEKVSTSFYDTYKGTWKGFGNSTTKGWQTVTFTDFYDWEYFSESMKTSKGAQLFWSWTKNSHIYIDEITFNAEKTPTIEVDQTEYKKGDTVTVNAWLAEDPTREVTISVVGPDGAAVTVTNNSFVMNVAGEYTITATLASPAHYVGSTSIVVEALVEHIVIDEYEDKAAVGADVIVPLGAVYDPYTKTELTDVAVSAVVTYQDENVDVVNGAFKAVWSGVYTITYSATLASGVELEETVKIFVSDRIVEFVPSEVDCLVGEAEWLEEYAGATSVMKATYSTNTYDGFLFKVNATRAELEALDWDYIEVKVYVGGTGSNPDPVYQVGDAYKYLGSFPRNTWSKVRLTKANIETVSGLDYFYENITGAGIELFWAWNATGIDWYIDYIQFGNSNKGTFTGVQNFDDLESAMQIYGLNNAQWFANYQGATGVVKGAYSDAWTGFQFRLDTTAEKLALLDWNYVELKITADFTGSRTTWDGLTSNAAGWSYAEEGVWRIYAASKTGIIAQYGSVENFYKAITEGMGSNDSSRLFNLWNLTDHGNFYFDYFKFVSRELPPEFEGVDDFVNSTTVSNAVGLVNAEWLESYEGATGVVKGAFSDDWDGFKFKLNTTTEKLAVMDWDCVEFKIAADFTGSRTTWDGTYESGWTYTTDGVWRIYSATKETIITQFGSLDAFYTAITTGSTRMFTLWNLTAHGNFYFDYFQLAKTGVSEL